MVWELKTRIGIEVGSEWHTVLRNPYVHDYLVPSDKFSACIIPNNTDKLPQKVVYS